MSASKQNIVSSYQKSKIPIVIFLWSYKNICENTQYVIYIIYNVLTKLYYCHMLAKLINVYKFAYVDLNLHSPRGCASINV